MQTHYTRYAEINKLIETLNAEKDMIRVDILNQMEEKGESKINTEVGTFSVSKLKSWTYPEKVVELGEKFKEEKAKAESTGEATYVESPSLRFTMLKL